MSFKIAVNMKPKNANKTFIKILRNSYCFLHKIRSKFILKKRWGNMASLQIFDIKNRGKWHNHIQITMTSNLIYRPPTIARHLMPPYFSPMLTIFSEYGNCTKERDLTRCIEFNSMNWIQYTRLVNRYTKN